MSASESQIIIKTIRRTKAEAGTVGASSRMTDERLDWHFLNWKSWMYAGAVGEGYPKETPGMFSSGNAHFDDMADASERRSAKACDAVINGLVPAQRAAVYHRYLHAVYRFPRGNLDDLLVAARDAVRSALQGKGIW